MPETKWDLAKSRVEFLGSLVNKVRSAHYKVQDKNKVDDLRKYRNILNTLYFEIDMYVDDWDFDIDEYSSIEEFLDYAAKEIRKKNNEDDLNEELRKLFSDLQSLDKKINQERKGAGLDIPQGYEPDPESGLADQA